MDDADRAQKEQEREMERRIAAARSAVASTPGPVECIKCGAINDRSAAGYAVCSDCVELTGAGDA